MSTPIVGLTENTSPLVTSMLVTQPVAGTVAQKTSITNFVGAIAPTFVTGTIDISTATGTQSIAHGLGRIPALAEVDFMADTYGNIGKGYSDGTTNNCAYRVSTIDANIKTNASIYFENPADSGVNYAGTITFDATNIIISWTRTGITAGNAFFIIKVQ